MDQPCSRMAAGRTYGWSVRSRLVLAGLVLAEIVTRFCLTEFRLPASIAAATGSGRIPLSQLGGAFGWADPIR